MVFFGVILRWFLVVLDFVGLEILGEGGSLLGVLVKVWIDSGWF